MRQLAISLLAVLTAASCLLFAACGQRGETASAVSAASSAVSAVSSGEADPTAPTEEDAGLTAGDGEDLNNPEEGEGSGLVIPIETDSPEFDAKFKDNPIDAAYVAESADLVSTMEIVEACERYAALWEKEIEVGMEKLLSLATDDREQYQKEQEDWETGRDANLKALAEQAGEGSLGRIEAAGSRMDFFRARANAVLRELYSYDPDFTYAYNSDDSSAVSAAG